MTVTAARAGPARWAMVAIATGSTTLAVIPSSLVAALSVLIADDLHFGASALGAATAAFFAATALSSIPGGRAVERLGPRRAIRIAAVITGLSLLGMGLLVAEWWHLLALLAVTGVANGLAQPGCNLALATEVPLEQQGTAFGIKQAAIPLSGVVAGASVPAVALTLGWRAAFATAAIGALLVVPLARLIDTGANTRADTGADTGAATGDAARGRGPRLPPRLVALAGSCGLGTSAGLCLTGFLVPYAVSAGAPVAAAGWCLAAGTAASVVTRLVIGRVADLHPERCLPVAALMVLGGAVPLALLATGASGTVVLVVLSVAGFSLGWGWPGLFAVSVVRLHPGFPAVASGVAQAGGALGGVLGPLTFGAIVSASGYPTAWGFSAVCACAAAAGLFGSGRRRMPRAGSGRGGAAGGPGNLLVKPPAQRRSQSS